MMVALACKVVEPLGGNTLVDEVVHWDEPEGFIPWLQFLFIFLLPKCGHNVARCLIPASIPSHHGELHPFIITAVDGDDDKCYVWWPDNSAELREFYVFI